MRWLAFALVLSSPALAQINLGTTVVVGYSKERIVVAADSRSTLSKEVHRDDACKITTLSDKLAFAAAGLVSDSSEAIPIRWRFNLADEAKNSAARFGTVKPPAGETVTEAVADDWLANARIKLEQAARYEMPNWLSTGVFPDGAVRFVGIFMGVEPDGKLSLVSESIYCKKSTSAASPFGCEPEDHIEWGLGPGKFSYPLSDRLEFRAFGITTPTDEYIAGDGRRAGTEWHHWEENKIRYPSTHTDAHRAIRLVDLTIAYSPEKEYVGGSIDALELTKDGFHWIARKPNCPY